MEIERDPQAVQAYERTRDEVAARMAVDEAEGILAHSWIAELEDVRRAALGVVTSMRLSARVALEDLHTAQRTGGPADVARAHARLVTLEAEQAVVFEQARGTLSFAETELESVGRAGLERSRRAQADLERLRAAWTRAYAES